MIWPLSLFYSGDADIAGKSDRPVSSEATKPSSPSPMDLLQHFESPCVPLPPSARVGDPKLRQREGQPLSIWQLGKMGIFAAMKATELVTNVVSYKVWGPPRKSWGIEMILLWSIMRDVGQHSHLADIATIRLLMSIGGFFPLPSDALVTPVTFRVRRRKLRGILADFDKAEDGTRELSGEWVVGKRTWQRLQREWRTTRTSSREGECRDEKSSQPSMQQPRKRERVVLYLHGGAYYVFSAATHRLVTIPLAKHLDARVFAVDYRLAPETRFPGPLHDVISAYLRLVNDLHIPPENIIVAGDSAGGGLSLALFMYLRDNDYPLPSGAILFSPWVDLTMSCDSWDSNAPYDIVPRPLPGDHLNPIACYLGEHMEEYLTHPYASPLFGDFKGLPPMLIQAGEVEVLRDEITLLAHKATLAGVGVRHELYEDCIHVFQTFPFLDAAKRAFVSSRDFVQNFLPQWQSRSPQALEGTAEKGLAQEIDNESARVVRGDGMETNWRREDISRPIKGSSDDRGRPSGRPNERDDQTVSPTPSREEDPSWGTRWPTPPTSDEEETGESPSTSKAEHLPSSHTREGDRAKPQERPSLRRLQSTISLIADASYRSAAGHLRRSPSYQHVQAHEPNPPQSPKTRYRASSLIMSSSKTPAPPPSIRRSDRSHPDINSLCQQYASSGPANQTMTFKPDTNRTRSRTVSFLSEDL
ncbi:hypothetical protein AcW1_001125 [Taiwanofungus camphoratus]|nr:hypothetical protein AcW1_001125 [Antrodia cinnamomea]